MLLIQTMGGIIMVAMFATSEPIQFLTVAMVMISGVRNAIGL